MKILITENTAASNEIIANEKAAANNGKTLLSMLDKLGLTVDSVNGWATIEQEFRKDYPKADLNFNLRANGLETEYRDAEAFYLKNRHTLRFTAVTDGEIESIKESQRVYATGNQIKVHALINEITDKLNNLQSLGVDINQDKVYLLNRVFEGDPRATPKIKVNSTNLTSLLINLK